MPFVSEKQRKFLWVRHPEIAKRWTKEYSSAIQPKEIPKKSFKKPKHRKKK